VRVVLQSVVDLTDIEQQVLLSTNAQELTGDWRAYWSRHPNSSVPRPTGISPTQALGQAIFDTADIEAMFVHSAKLPDHRNLVIFPQKLRPGSRLTFVNQISGESHTIP
jgi:hypothetical protein